MFVLHANKNRLTVKQRETLTSGSVNVYTARFEFSPDWTGLTTKAVFKSGGKAVAVLLDDSGECVIPWEVLSSHGRQLTAGAYGTTDETVLPTVWADLGTIQEGVTAGDNAQPPTPNLWQQELDQKGDGLAYDGLNLSLMSGDEVLSSVEIAGGDGEGGTTDHRFLSGRSAENQHPINAIAGLQEILDSIPQPMAADELRKILMNGDG